jgi:myosin-5
MLQFNDNQVCLDLIENSPLSILNILDEECRFPKSNEKTFADKLYHNHSSHSNFQKPRFSNIAFTILHYADNVTYDCTHFLAKNKDYIVSEQVSLLKDTSGDTFVKELFGQQQSSSSSNSSFKFTSVAAQFKESLNLLMDKISKTYPHYIRCIKPNSQKKANLFNFDLVLQQLKCGGIHESIRICLEGYPTKKLFKDFLDRYKIISPEEEDNRDVRQACHNILNVMNIEPDGYQFGTTKIFLRSGQIERIEMLRTSKLNHSAVLIQKNVRRMIERKKWIAIRTSTIGVQKTVRSTLAGYNLETLRENNSSKKIGQTISMALCRQELQSELLNIQFIKNLAGAQLQLSGMIERQLTLRLALAVQTRYRYVVKRNEYLQILEETKGLEAIKKQKEGLELRVEELQFKINSDHRVKTQLEEEKIRLERELNETMEEVKSVEYGWKQKYTLLDKQHNSLKQDFKQYKFQMEQELQKKSQLELEQDHVSSSLLDVQREYNEHKLRYESDAKKSNDYIKKLLDQLEKEREARESLEKKVAAMEAEKLRLKKRKDTEMAYEVDKILNYLSGDRQEQAERFVVFLIFELEKEYANHIIPTPAFLLYHLVNCWKSNIEGSERLFQLIENSLIASLSTSDLKTLPYWMATVSALVQLFSDVHFLSSIPYLQEQSYDPEQIHQQILSVICTDSYITFEQELMQLSIDQRQIEDNNNPFIKFFIQMASVLVKGYSQLIDSICNQIGALLKVHKIDESYSNGTGSISSFESVVLSMKQHIEQLRNFKLSENIIARAIQQIITFVDITLFNEILLRKDICSSAKANQMKYNVTQLEKEASIWTGTTVVLPLVTQACNLLLCDKKTLTQEKHRSIIAPNLNSLQILKILQMYNYNEFEARIPNEVYSYFRSPKPALVSIFPENSVILDPKEIVPFNSFEDIVHYDIESELPYVSFPISVKEKLDHMYTQEIRRKEQEIASHLNVTTIIQRPPPHHHTDSSVNNNAISAATTDKKKKRGFSLWGSSNK